MTDPLHDDAVSRRYRELPPEEPPRAMDEAILAASRRAVHARPTPPQLSSWAPAGRRWYVPLAAAAVIVLAAGLGLHLQLERPEIEDVTPPSPTVLKTPQPKEQATSKAAEGKPKVAQAAPSSQPDKETEAPATQNRSRRKAEERAEPAASQARGDSAQPFKDESLARAAPAAPAADAATAESRVAAAPKAQAMRAPAPAAAPPAAGARADDQNRDRAEQSVASGAMAKRSMAIEETPEKALERIAALRAAGKHDEADKALAEFRKRFPDYKLSDEMKAKVERR